MKRVLIGIVLGAIVGSGSAVAAVEGLTIPPGGVALLRDPGSTKGTLLRFQHFDLNCIYMRSSAPPPENQISNEPTLTCGRASNWNHSRRLLITPYRVFIWNAQGDVTYKVTRTP